MTVVSIFLSNFQEKKQISLFFKLCKARYHIPLFTGYIKLNWYKSKCWVGRFKKNNKIFSQNVWLFRPRLVCWNHPCQWSGTNYKSQAVSWTCAYRPHWWFKQNLLFTAIRGLDIVTYVESTCRHQITIFKGKCADVYLCTSLRDDVSLSIPVFYLTPSVCNTDVFWLLVCSQIALSTKRD